MQSQGAKVKNSKKHNAKVCQIPSAVLGLSFVSYSCLAGQQSAARALQIQEDIANLIAQIVDTMQELEKEERSALGQLDQVEAEPIISMDDDQSLPPIEEARAPDPGLFSEIVWQWGPPQARGHMEPRRRY